MLTEVSEVKEALAPVFDRYQVSKAVVFGSVAKGTADDQGDLDILVDSHLQGFKFCGLMEAIREAVDMPVDVLDVTHIEADSPIDREIRRTGVTIYER